MVRLSVHVLQPPPPPVVLVFVPLQLLRQRDKNRLREKRDFSDGCVMQIIMGTLPCF
jgi:hypothetical protein